eukprot:145830_1
MENAPPSLPDFKEAQLDDAAKDALSAFFEEIHKWKAKYKEHHSNETTLMDKCRESQNQLNVLQNERNVLKDDSENVQIQIESIQNTINNVESNAKELKHSLNLKKEDLGIVRTQNDELLIDLENITNELESEREELTKSLEKKIDHLFNQKNLQNNTLNDIRTVSSQLFSNVQKVENEKHNIITFVSDLNIQIDQTNAEIVNKKKKYKNLELEIKNLESDCDTVGNELSLKKEMFGTQKQHLLSATKQVKEALHLVSENKIKLDSSQQCLECLHDELKILNEDNLAMKQVTEQQRHDIDGLNEEIHKKLEAKHKLNKKIGLIHGSITAIEKETAAAHNKKEKWYTRCNEIKKEIKILENKVTIGNKQFDAAQRERELIQSYHENKCKSVQDVEIMIFTAESSLKSLDNEISSNLNVIKKLKKTIESTCTDLNKHKYELAVKKNKLAKMELKYKSMACVEDNLQSKIAQNESLLKQQESLIEAVRVDKNVYNKSLIDQKEEMNVFKREFNSLNHGINQIKMELAEKDQMYITQHFNVDKVDKDVQIIRNKIEGINKKITQSDTYIEDVLKDKLNELNELILKSDHILKSQHKQHNAIISESKHLSTNLIQKNNELTSIKEKIRLLNSMFAKGNAAYNDECKWFITAQQSHQNLATNLHMVERKINELEVLKSQILSMENELLSQHLKIESLKDELCRPVNIHRWRQLKDTNPEIFELIEKSHKLTKQLLVQNRLIYDKQQAIHNKETLYVNLRKILARQPGNEAREQLNIYLNTLNEKKSKLKQLINQLNIYQNKVHLLKHEINILSKDKNAIKLQYFQIKNKQYTESVTVLQSRQDQNKENVSIQASA